MQPHSENVEIFLCELFSTECPPHLSTCLQSMCRGLQWLETLDLSECEALTSQALQTLAYHCHYLRHLHLSSCYNVRPSLDSGLQS